MAATWWCSERVWRAGVCSAAHHSPVASLLATHQTRKQLRQRQHTQSQGRRGRQVREKLEGRAGLLQWSSKQPSEQPEQESETLQTVAVSRDPSELVQDALVALRKGDYDRFSGQMVPGPLQLGHAEQHVLLVGGRPLVEPGPLARFADVMDTGARRLLPGNLLRRCQVLSSLRILPGRFQQRVAVTACSGEEGVLEWSLVERQGSWWVAHVKRDASCDYPLPESPHPRVSPEAVVLAQLTMLECGHVHRAARFNGADVSKVLMDSIAIDNSASHSGSQAELGASALPAAREFVQEVTLSGQAKGQPGQEARETGMLTEAYDAKLDRHIRKSILWKLALQVDGCWLVQSIERVGGALVEDS